MSSNDAKAVEELSRLFIVPICLKRYMMTESGSPKRRNTFIDIPDNLSPHQFMALDETLVEDDPAGFGNRCQFVLQSVVCHRGESLHSGHYIAFARAAPKQPTDGRRKDRPREADSEETRWVKFDDLLDRRVTYVDSIKESLKSEAPYLLFYQMVPVGDTAHSPSATSTETETTSYKASHT